MRAQTWEDEVLPLLDNSWTGTGAPFTPRRQEWYRSRLAQWPGEAVLDAVERLALDENRPPRRPSLAELTRAVERSMGRLRLRIPHPDHERRHCRECETSLVPLDGSQPPVYCEDLADGSVRWRGRCPGCQREIDVVDWPWVHVEGIGWVRQGPDLAIDDGGLPCPGPDGCPGRLVQDEEGLLSCPECSRLYVQPYASRPGPQRAPDGSVAAARYQWLREAVLPLAVARAWEEEVEFDPTPYRGEPDWEPTARRGEVPAALFGILAYGAEQGWDETLQAILDGRPTTGWVDLYGLLVETFGEPA